MWLRCRQCDRTILCLDAVIPSPYRCRGCREAKPDWRPRESRAAIEGPVARVGEIEAGREAVIDITPEETPPAGEGRVRVEFVGRYIEPARRWAQIVTPLFRDGD